MNEEGLSESKRTTIANIFAMYIRSGQSNEVIPAQMWLSVVDLALKFDNDDLSTFAKAKFYEKFDWSLLQTPKPKENEKDAAGGRKVKNQKSSAEK